jgi:hypothetical protein
MGPLRIGRTGWWGEREGEKCLLLHSRAGADNARLELVPRHRSPRGGAKLGPEGGEVSVAIAVDYCSGRLDGAVILSRSHGLCSCRCEWVFGVESEGL